MPLSFFSRKPKQVPEPTAPTTEPPVAYDPELVAELTQEHRHLVLLLDRAKGSVQGKRFEDVKGMLDQLREGLAAHVKRENEELHPYLTAKIRNDDRIAMLKDMHSGALRTQRALDGFLKHYGGYPVTERNAATFYSEIDGVNVELNKWMAQEEAFVYTLYKSPESY
jgi:hypothetical protein